MTRKEFKAINGFNQGDVIVRGDYPMTKTWARQFIAEQKHYSPAWWSPVGHKLWKMAHEKLDIPLE